MQAKLFLADALKDGYEENGEPRPGQKEALAILQSVLKDDPDNSAANHYWIHAVETSRHPEQALHSAEILGRSRPRRDTWSICPATSTIAPETTPVRSNRLQLP